MSRSAIDSGILSFDSGIDLLSNVELPVIEQKSVAETRSWETGSLVSLFSVGLLLVAGCSVYDAFLVYQYRDVIDEQNQFCRWLIELEPESVSIFLVAKLMGTAAVIASVVTLAKIWRRAAHASLASLVVFQIGLMGYLHCYDSVAAQPATSPAASMGVLNQVPPVALGWDESTETEIADSVAATAGKKKSKRIGSNSTRSIRRGEPSGQPPARVRARKLRQLKRIEKELKNLDSRSR